MSVMDDAVPLIRAQRRDGNLLKVVCPFCRGRHGRLRYHEHGTGGMPGPWHRLAHCADSELLPDYRGQRFLAYTIDEPSVPRVIERSAAVDAEATRERRLQALWRGLN